MNKNTINNAYQLHKIKDAFFEGKSKVCIKLATEYLELKPNDIDVRFMRAKSYRHLNMFNLALEDLEYNINMLEKLKSSNAKEQLKDSIVELFHIYYHLNNYMDALKLLPIIYKNNFISHNIVQLMEIIMKKQLRLPIFGYLPNIENYIEGQIDDYSEKRAFNYILPRTKADIDVNTKSKFNENINMNYLFEIIKTNINHNNKANTDDAFEVHYFAISNIGIYKNDICNYIKVKVIPNTTNILYIYPITGLKYENPEPLTYDRSKLFNEQDVKVNQKSRIDRFKTRYNIK